MMHGRSGERKIAILAEKHFHTGYAKTALGVIKYATDPILCVLDSNLAGKTSQDVVGFGGDIPIIANIDQAIEMGATHLLIGIAPSGGGLPEEWRPVIIKALKNKMTVINGLHYFFNDDPEFQSTMVEFGGDIWDVRQPPKEIPLCRGKAVHTRAKRILTVGMDCAVGKMSVSLEMHKCALKHGYTSKFVATGQTGIMIEGDGMPIDRIIGDFMSGAVEKMCVDWGEDYDWLMIEGQGALNHPSYSGVALALIHGCAPDAMVLVHEPLRQRENDLKELTYGSIKQMVELNEMLTYYVKPSKVVCIGVNTRGMTDDQARKAIDQIEAETGFPVNDVFRFDTENLFDAVENHLNMSPK